MQINGTIEKFEDIEEIQSKNGQTYKSQNLILKTADKFNPMVCIKFFGDQNIQSLSTYYKRKGESVVVDVNVSSREYNGKWYHNIDAWKISTTNANELNARQPENKLPWE